jgi:hypothetical protein
MAYTINKTSGAVLATIADGTLDSTTDLTLIGKNYSGYGEAFNENFVALLENFSNNVAPTSPLAGQLWWDSSNALLKVYTGSTFKTVSSSTASATQPATGVVGDLWWDTANSQLKVYNGASWTLVGPAYASGAGQSGPVIETITDSGGSDHVVVQMMNSDTIVSIINKDAAFTPQSSITGFSSIKQGYTLNSSLAAAKYNGTATDADALGGVGAANYLRSDANDTSSGTLGIINDNGITIGTDSDLSLTISGDNIILKNQTQDGDIVFRVNDGGVTTTLMTLDGATSEAQVAANPTTDYGIATKKYVDDSLSGIGGGSVLLNDGSNNITGTITPDTDQTYDFGSTTKTFNTVYAQTFSGTSVTAQYADLAERFAADAFYAPGTVVALGGVEEITRVAEEGSESVFGVISTQPAYLMNSSAGTNDTHPPVAMSGRVPVLVTGKVNKGDRLISAGSGLAKAATKHELTAFNVIGRALENKDTNGRGTIEAFVKIN